jgi:hypothetical protein
MGAAILIGIVLAIIAIVITGLEFIMPVLAVIILLVGVLSYIINKLK